MLVRCYTFFNIIQCFVIIIMILCPATNIHQMGFIRTSIQLKITNQNILAHSLHITI